MAETMTTCVRAGPVEALLFLGVRAEYEKEERSFDKLRKNGFWTGGIA